MAFKNLILSFRRRIFFVPGYLTYLLAHLVPSFRMYVTLLNYLSCTINISKSVTLHRGIRLTCVRNLTIKRGSTINANCLLDTRGDICIGSDTMVGSNTVIYTQTHDVESKTFETITSKVVIGDNVVIFPHCLIMPGVTIGNEAVVYPGSVVTKNVGDRQIVGGVPAKLIKMRKCKHQIELRHETFFFV